MGGHANIEQAIWLSDRDVAAIGSDGRLNLWNARAGTVRAALSPADGGHFDGLSSAGNFRRLLTFSDERAQLRDALTLEQKAEFSVTKDGDHAWSSDGQTLAIGASEELLIVAPESGAVQHRIKESDWVAFALAPSGDSLVVKRKDLLAAVHDARTGKLRCTVPADGAGYRDFWWAGKDALILQDDKGVSVFEASTCAKRQQVKKRAGEAGDPLVLSGEDSLTLVESTGRVTVIDLTGRRAPRFLPSSTPSNRARAGPNGMLAQWTTIDGIVMGEIPRGLGVTLFDTKTGKDRGYLSVPNENISRAYFSGDGTRVIAQTGDGRLLLFDTRKGKLIASLRTRNWVAEISPDGNFALAVGSSLRLVRLSDGASISLADYGDATRRSELAFTDEGDFDGDERAYRNLLFAVGPDMVSSDQLFEHFYHPNLATDFFAGRSIDPSPEARLGVGIPPSVEFVRALPRQSGEDELEVCLRATDRGGGVEDVRLFVNGARVTLNDPGGVDDRGFKRPGAAKDDCDPALAKDGVLIRRGRFALAAGENDIHAEAFATVGKVRSAPARAAVTYRAADKDRPALHLIAMSVDAYEDPSQRLSFANADADAIVSALQAEKGRLYSEVHVQRLKDSEVTPEKIDAAVAKAVGAIRPIDVVVVYAAGHGVMAQCPDETEPHYRFLGWDAALRNDASVCARGISDEKLAALARTLPARKKLVVLDTCHAGGAATGKLLVAMRGAKELEAIRKLARAEGLAVVAAAQEAQYAGEVKALGHGIFTYALLEALRGKAGSPLTVFGMLGHVQTRVPELSREHWGNAQNPIVSMQGQDFPVAIP